MNIKSKTVLTSALFTVLLAATSAQANQRGHVEDYVDNTTPAQSVEIKKVSLTTAIISSDYSENGGRK